MIARQGSDCSACPLGETSGVINGMDRRDFVSRAVAAAGAALLAACAGVDSLVGPLDSPVTVNLSQYPALATVGGMAAITAGNARLEVVRTGTSTFVALSLVCPHEGATINTSSNGFTCPRHGARFDANGAWTGGQRTSSMRSYPTQYDSVAGTLTIG